MAMQSTEELLKSSTETAKQAAQVIGKDFEQGVGVVPSKTPINSGTLSSEPDMDIPDVPPDTTAEGEIARFEQQTDQFTKNQQQRVEETGNAEETSFLSYIQSSLEAPTREELEATAYAGRGGVDEIQAELDDINQRIIGEQHALNRRLRELDKNKQGLFGGGLQVEKQRAVDRSLERQADLSIIQMGIQGKFDSAREIADRAVDAKFARVERELNIRGLIYERNKSLFDTAEQRAFETAQADRERKLNEEKEERKTVSDLSIDALTNGAPKEVVARMREAATVEDAIRVGGNYVGYYDRVIKQMQIDNIKSQIDDRQNETGKDLSSSELTALGFAERTLDAAQVIDELGEQFTGAGAFGSWLPNPLKSEDRQRYEQAQRNFVNAVLRKESGAAIGEDEFDSARLQYFPQRGDSLSVVQQKQQNRNRVIANLLREGGQDASLYVAAYNDPMNLGINESTEDPLGLNQTSTSPL